MATLVAHAAIPVLTRRLVAVPEHLERRLLVAAVALACWQDADYATLAFEVRPEEMLGHRGLTHGLFVAAALALVVAFAAFRELRGTRAFWVVAAFLFVAGASHGVLDALTGGDVGVALLAPLSNARFASPFKLLASCPGGVDEMLGYWGVMTIANELLYVVVPLKLLVDALRFADMRRRLAGIACVWGIALFTLRTARPEGFRPTAPRPLLPIDTKLAGYVKDIPTEGLPDGRLLTRLPDLRARGLFDVRLEPSTRAWSSTFFPKWFGSEGGRWMDATPKLVWRTLFGFSPVDATRARAWLAAAKSGDPAAERALFDLAPTEKLDLALGRFDFPAQSDSLAGSANMHPKPRYWSGLCNGVATASLYQPEPFRVVDVITADGARVRFHPNDVKALLALSYDEPRTMTVIGDVCGRTAFDAGAECSMSPAVFLVAALNRIGIAKTSFLVDALPTIAKQYYAVAAVRFHLRGEPRPMDRTPASPALAGRTASLVDVDMDVVLSSTTLAYARADVLASPSDVTRYRRVGLVPVEKKYEATLALDRSGELVGGRWIGSSPDGPDDILIVGGGPTLTESGDLDNAKHVPWWFVQELARASVDDGAAVPTVDLRAPR